MSVNKLERRASIKKRIRKIVQGTTEKPRLCIFRSNKEIYAQMIDDLVGITLVSASSKDKSIIEIKGTKIDKAKLVGKLIAEKSLEKGINCTVFDRGGYLYHGRVKALAESARENGLKF